MAYNPYDIADAILPDDFDINNPNYSLSDSVSTGETAPTTEQSTEYDNASEVTEETSTQQEATEVTEESAPTTEPVAPVMPTTVRVKYNHEERELGLDEAAIYAQKGMNYDKLEQRNRELEAAAEKSRKLAKHLGYDSSEEMLSAAESNYIKRRENELIKNGNTPEMAKFLVEQEMAKAAAAEEREAKAAPTASSQPNANLSPEREAELREFVTAYPGVTKLPNEVIKANLGGTRLLVAYERYQNQAAQAEAAKKNSAQQAELAILKQNQASAAKAPVGGVTGKAVPRENPEDNDPFMKGFNADAW